MFKLKMDLDIDVDALEQQLDVATKTAINNTAQPLKSFLSNLAESKLDNSITLWQEGLRVDSIGEDSYIIGISGKLAEMIEDGFTGQQLKEILLAGPRAAHNAAESPNNTKYVDVPFGISRAKIQSGKIEGVTLSKFRDADAVVKSFTQTNKAGQVGRGSALTKRVENVIESYGKGTKVGFMTIKRVSEKSKLDGWSGAKILDKNAEIDKFISDNFNTEFYKVF